MKKTSAQCPINHKLVDENSARLTAFFSIILALVGLYDPTIWMLLTGDILLRYFIKFSPISYFSRCLVKLLGFKPAPVDAAPKRFATLIALVMMALVLLFEYFQFRLGAIISLGALVTAMSLFAFFNYCFACTLYPLFRAFTKR